MRTIVVDASVVLGWYLADETRGGEVLALLDSFVREEVRLIAPVLLEYEVLNGLLLASRRGRLELETAKQAWRGFQALGMILADIAAEGDDVLRASEDTGLTAYDGAYLALAAREKAELATMDKSLAAAAKNERIKLVW
ncbi:MAG: type II toxin-antitoxin system VapC family toxin [Candidatus Aminicenantales bacterium]